MATARFYLIGRRYEGGERARSNKTRAATRADRQRARCSEPQSTKPLEEATKRRMEAAK